MSDSLRQVGAAICRPPVADTPAPPPEAERQGNEAFVALVQSAIRGDKDALIDLCRTIAKSVLFRTLRIMSNDSDAADVAQEVMLRICANIQDLKSPKAFYVWLNTIITNETNRFLARNSKTGILLNIDDFTEEFMEDNEDFLPQECVIRESDRNVVIEMIDRLPTQQRKAVSLYYYDGLTLEEAAGVMGVSQPRVSRCLMFAREKIKKELMARAERMDSAIYGLAVAPTGPLLAEVMRQGAEQFIPTDPVWMHELIGSCTKAIGDMGAPAIDKAGSAQKASALGNKLMITAAIASAAIAGVLFGLAPEGEAEPPASEYIATTNYSIAFTGGDELYEHVNPNTAVALVDTPQGEMEAHNWWITAVGSSNVLYSGDGCIVDDALAELWLHGESGEYVLRFRMVDTNGNIYTLSRIFAIER